jgi:hypothetical protein
VRTSAVIAGIVGLLAASWSVGYGQPVDPYARDPNAPVPAAGDARGWEVRPEKSERTAVRWAKSKTKKGVKLSLQMVLAPVAGALKLNERYEVVRRVESFLYNDERTAAVLPSASFLTDFGSSIGADIFHKDLFGHGEHVELNLSYGGVYNQAYQLGIDLPQLGDERFYLEAVARYEGESTLFFDGLGHPAAPADATMAPFAPREVAVKTEFRQRRKLAVGSAGVRLGDLRLLRLGVSAIYNVREFGGQDPDDEDTSIEEIYDTSQLAGFDEGEDVLELTAEVVLDTRDLVGKTGRGALVDAFFGGAPSLDGNPYLHYGIEASYFRTLFRRGRVVVLRAMLEGVEGDEERIPFTELPRVGGPNRLRGYRIDRFRDNLAAIGTLEYRYPIHHLASGLFFIEAGKVAREYDELWSTDHWQPGFGGGVVIHTLEDVKLRFDVAYGEGLVFFVSTDALAAFRGRRREL